MKIGIDKRVLNLLVIIILSFITFIWTFWIFHKPFELNVVLSVIAVRIIASILIFKDFSLSWSKVTQKTFLIKSLVYISAFLVYMPFFHGKVRIALLASELFLYLFSINFLMYLYFLIINRAKTKKTKSLVVYGAGKAGLKLEEEFRDSEYKIKYFIDDDKSLQTRSIDGIDIISNERLEDELKGREKLDLLVIAIPSAKQKRINEIYDRLKEYFYDIKILPSLDEILSHKAFSSQLKDISIEDLLARRPKDLDKVAISDFVRDRVVFITGGGGSIGSELCRQVLRYGAKRLYILDHSEYNLYKITEELNSNKVVPIMATILDKESLQESISEAKPDIFIHAAAYKHVPLVEKNVKEGILNNIIGTKNCIDLSIKYDVSKFIFISTDKAVRPTNVMGLTKRVCELYAGNVKSNKTEIVSVRFGNVLGSSGSVVPKFKEQIQKGGPLTVTHPEITRYFMLIPEACELVLQTGAIAKGKEIFILDMGEPVKIVDLAKKMIELSGKKDIDIVFTGLRAGEKLYEELLINESDKKTIYESIMIAKESYYDIDKLNRDIEELLSSNNKIEKLKEIVPEFNTQKEKEKK